MPVTSYPRVKDEFATIKALHDGLSIGRWGDGECKVARGESYVREPANTSLALELRNAIAHPNPRFLPAIPNLDPRSPKYENWLKRAPAFLPFLSPDVQYYASTVTRPDTSPWIATQEYATSVVNLWRGRKVILVSEPTSKLLTLLKGTARKYVHIPCPSHGAYAHIDEYERQIWKGHPDVALLSHGVSATCLAHRLACRGIQALDLGSIGAFLLRMLPRSTQTPGVPAVLRHPECATAVELRAKLEGYGFEVQYCGEKSNDSL